jgi:siderophore synthetase component
MFLAIQNFPFFCLPQVLFKHFKTTRFVSFEFYKLAHLLGVRFTLKELQLWKLWSSISRNAQQDITNTYMKKNGSSYKRLVLHKFMMNPDCGSKMKH